MPRPVLAPFNPTLGDLEGNAARIRDIALKAEDVQILAFPELALCGYPPEDLVLRPHFVASAEDVMARLAHETAGGPALIVGGPMRGDGVLPHNAVYVLDGGQVIHRQAKHVLPTYGVFDEARTFASGPLPQPVAIRGEMTGLLVCEDMWTPQVAAHLAAQGAQRLVALNASPYEIGKPPRRRAIATLRAKETGLPLAYVNQLGGQDDLVFDGDAFAIDAVGTVIMQGALFGDALLSRGVTPLPDDLAADYGALVLGLRDYVRKNRFPGVVLGLSGGIDSALVLTLAVDALGPERVRAVMMPSPYTSQASLEDAAEQARALGVAYDLVPIEGAMGAFDAALDPHFSGHDADVARENLQSRIRGTMLMALSNVHGALVLATGNKSEYAVGYATLYGDMNGGYAPLKDVYKTRVYALVRWRNGKARAIPERVLEKAPTAELRPNQTDQDSLPPYDLLDAILYGLIEERASVAGLVARGFDAAVVAKTARLLYGAEFKRRQSAPGPKITRLAFGRERRHPITDAWRD